MTIARTDILPGDVLTRAEIKPVFGGSVYEGICPAVDQHNVLLFSDAEVGRKFGYEDGWLSEEDEHGRIFEYTGTGKRGDQTFVGTPAGGKNAAVLRHAEQERTLRLFVAVGKFPGTDTKLHRYVGAFKLDEQLPYVVRMARDETGRQRRVIVFRLRPDGPVQVLEGDKNAPASQTMSVLVPANATTAKIVEPERNKNKKGYRSAAPATEVERREAALSDAFEAYLRSHQHEVYRFEIRIKGTTTRLLTDLYDATAHVLYELKGSRRREAVRMALGQLLDYSRHIEVDKHVGPPRMVGLFPGPLDDDLRALLACHAVHAAYRDGDAFIGALLSAP